MNSDITPGEGPRLIASADGRWLTFLAPSDGCLPALADRDARRGAGAADRRPPLPLVVRPGRARPRGRRGSPTSARRRPSCRDVWVRDGVEASPAALTSFNADVLADSSSSSRSSGTSTVDGRDIQGWFIPARRRRARQPLVTQIHGGPHTLYGWTPFLEFQILAAAGIGVFYSNPRGSEGYGLEFNEANLRDWGPGPMRDVLAGIDALVADGLADRERLGLTGGSYGGYLTNWIIAHDQRFAAAMTCRCVSDMTMLFLTGDISGGEWAELEFGTTPWDDPAYFREISPLTYADRDPHAAAHPAQRARHPDDGRPGRGPVHGPAVEEAARPPDARPGGDPRADPIRHAVPPGREPRPGPGLVPPLPRRGEAGLAAAAEGPRRPLTTGAGRARRALRQGLEDPAAGGQPLSQVDGGVDCEHPLVARRDVEQQAVRRREEVLSCARLHGWPDSPKEGTQGDDDGKQNGSRTNEGLHGCLLRTLTRSGVGRGDEPGFGRETFL